MLLEIAVQDVEGIQVARDHGADRAELCQALEVGGLTPTTGMVRRAVELGLPSRALIRPRAGGYEHSEAEIAAMVEDVRALLDAGADGVIVGALRTSAAGPVLDRSTLERLIAAADGAPVVVHRCVDVVLEAGTAAPDRLIAELSDLGAAGLLTSGGAPTAPEGTEVIAQLTHAAAGRLEVIAGGGVRAPSIPALARAGADVVHLSAGAPVRRGAPGPGGGDPSFRTTSAELVAEARTAVDAVTGGSSTEADD